MVLVGWGLTSVHCPLVCTMSMTQGSDLFSVSRSSRALQDTRSSTLETQVAGPLRLVAGEVASWTSFILAQSTRSCQPAEQYSVRLVGVAARGLWRARRRLGGSQLRRGVLTGGRFFRFGTEKGRDSCWAPWDQTKPKVLELPVRATPSPSWKKSVISPW